MIGLLFEHVGALGDSTRAMIALALVFALLIGGVFAVDNPHVKRVLREISWYRRFERLRPAQLRFHGMVSLGLGLCSFAALLTLKLLFPQTGIWPGLSLGMATVITITLGAALLERAAHLEGWR